MPKLRLTLLVGMHTQKAYPGETSGRTLTETVRRPELAPPGFLPVPHPASRSTGWMGRNPWFEAERLPALRPAVAASHPFLSSSNLRTAAEAR